MEEESDRAVRLEARAEGDHVQITIAHSGPAFEQPERAFDPYVPSRSGGGDAAWSGAEPLRDYSARQPRQRLAMNLDPRGAAILLELQAA